MQLNHQGQRNRETDEKVEKRPCGCSGRFGSYVVLERVQFLQR